MTNPVTEIYYVWAAYGAAALIVAVIVGLTLLDARSQRRQLAEIEARGVKRRSAANPAAPQS